MGSGQVLSLSNARDNYLFQVILMYKIILLFQNGSIISLLNKGNFSFKKGNDSFGYFLNPLSIFSSITTIFEFETSCAVNRPNTGFPSDAVKLPRMLAGGTLNKPPVCVWLTN